MTVDVVPYRFIDAERLRFGRYPVLDTILYRWARRIEETLFEEVRGEIYSGASVCEEMKFSTFYQSLRRPRPIYFFELSPLEGQGLFVADNRFSAFCLSRTAPPEERGEELRLAPGNQGRLQRVVQRMMADFDAAWADIHPVHTRLRKLTTFPFRARILNPYEPCLVAQIHLSGRDLSSRLTWCLPRVMLEPLLERLSRRRILPPLSPGRRGGGRLRPERLLARTRYTVPVSLGRMEARTAAEGLKVGAVLPVRNETGGNAVLKVDGRPVLVAKVGELKGHYALRVEGRYSPPREPPPDPAQFRAVDWPAVPGE